MYDTYYKVFRKKIREREMMEGGRRKKEEME